MNRRHESDLERSEKQIEYPEPVCMFCGLHCERQEEVSMDALDEWPHEGELELWCYCVKCDVETFHPIPKKKDKNA